MHIYFINFFINFFKILYTPIIIPFRKYIREYVYNYLIKNNITFLFPYDIQLVNLTTYCKGNEVYLKYKKTNKYLYYFYYWFFWVWYDDETYDNINLLKLYELCYKNNLAKYLLEKDLSEVTKCIKYTTFNKPYIDFNPSKYTLLLYVSLFYNNNNYYNLKYYSKKRNKIHKKLIVKNYLHLYKAE